MADERTITVTKAVQVLNEALERDPVAMNALIELRIPCNDALADHPTIQVTSDHKIGVLGLINGLFGADVHNMGTIGGAMGLECGCKPEEMPGGLTCELECPKCGKVPRIMPGIKRFDDMGFNVRHPNEEREDG